MYLSIPMAKIKKFRKNLYLQEKTFNQPRNKNGRFAKKANPVIKATKKTNFKVKNNLKSFSTFGKSKNSKSKKLKNVFAYKISKQKTETKKKTKPLFTTSLYLKQLALLLSIFSLLYYTQRFLRFNGLNIIGLTTIFRNLNLFPDTNYQLMLTLNPTASYFLDFLFILMAIAVVLNFLVAFITLLSIREWFVPNLILSSFEAATILAILIVLFVFFEFNVFALLTYIGLFFMLAFAIMKIGTAIWNYIVKE
jgi:hypothetical protein